MTWWTRHDSTEPELSDDEEDETGDEPPTSEEKDGQDGNLTIEEPAGTEVVAKSRTYMCIN